MKARLTSSWTCSSSLCFGSCFHSEKSSLPSEDSPSRRGPVWGVSSNEQDQGGYTRSSSTRTGFAPEVIIDEATSGQRQLLQGC